MPSGTSNMKEALTSLGPSPFAEVPTSNDKLSDFLKTHLTHAELLANSIPVPPSNNESSPFSAAALPAVNSAKTPSDTLLDPSNLPLTNIQTEHPEILKGWGKPMKFSAKDNPLHVAVYKMAAHDRHGAWFSRRSVHAGLGFNRFKRAMQREFLESLPVKEGPGSGAVRGIAADRKLESHSVEGVGSMDIWQLSSAFPGPVTPREFVCMNITSEHGTGAGSHFEGIDKAPRTFIVVSKPTTHTDAPDRSGLVKGEYESVEMIREVPVEGADPEQNPVEWLMITRSDPGGGIPKFMVERGTPGSIVADVPKWLEWAIKKGDIPDSDLKAPASELQAQNETTTEAEHGQNHTQEHAHDRSIEKAGAPTGDAAADEHASGMGGWMSSVTHAVEGAVGAYLPAYFHHDEDADSGDTSSISSGSTFHTTVNHQHADGATHLGSPVSDSTAHLERPVHADEVDAEALTQEVEAKGAHNQAERELLKIVEKRRALDAKIAAARADEEQRAHDAVNKTAKERAKADEKLERDRKKSEDNYKRQLEKLDKRREKEARKVEEKRRKAEAKDALLAARRERDEFKDKWRVAEQEVDLLRRQADALLRENAALAARMAAGDAGPDALRKVRDECGGALSSDARSRAASKSSKRSTDSASKKSLEVASK